MALTIDLELDELNIILQALGTQPFVQVTAVITKITQQAQEQLNAQRVQADPELEPAV